MTRRPPAPGADVAGYLRELTERLREVLDRRLVGAWVVGSSALGDFDPRRSDIDVQAVCSERPSRAELLRLAGLVSHDALPCPARGLEFVDTPEERPYGIDASFRDPSGNHIRLTQVRELSNA